jgi:hypothetical protein
MANHKFSIVSLLLITPMMYGMNTKSPGSVLEEKIDKVLGETASQAGHMVGQIMPTTGQVASAANGVLTTVQDELQSVEQRVIALDPNILMHVAVGLVALEGCKMAWQYVWAPKDPIYAHAHEELNPTLKSADAALSRVPTLNDYAVKEDVDIKLGGMKTHFLGLAAGHDKRHDETAQQITAINTRLDAIAGNVGKTMEDVVSLKKVQVDHTKGLATIMTMLNGTEKQPGIIHRHEHGTKELTARIVALQTVDAQVSGRLEAVEKMNNNVVALQNHSILVDKALGAHDARLADHDKKFTDNDAAHRQLDANIKKVASAASVPLDQARPGILDNILHRNKNSDHPQQRPQSPNNNNNNSDKQ